MSLDVLSVPRQRLAHKGAGGSAIDLVRLLAVSGEQDTTCKIETWVVLCISCLISSRTPRIEGKRQEERGGGAKRGVITCSVRELPAVERKSGTKSSMSQVNLNYWYFRCFLSKSFFE
jgi:hypothetical protein